METVRSEHRIRFRTFTLDVRTHELFRDGLRLKLQGHPIEVLRMLAERPGELVTREELQKALWPDHTYVDFEHGLNSCMNRLREALGDHAEGPRYIETLPRLGYRFIAPVECLVEDAASLPAERERPATDPTPSAAGPRNPPQIPADAGSAQSRSHGYRIALVAIAVVAAVAAAFWLVRRPLPPPRVADYVQLTHDGQLKFPAATDGNRIYLNQWRAHEVAQVPSSGGEVAPIPIDMPAPWVRDVSPDGSNLIVLNNPADPIDLGLWIVGVTGRPARYLTIVTDATWFPDGKSIVYATANGNLYLVPAEGGPSRLLASVPNHGGGDAVLRDLACSPDGSEIRFTRNLSLWEISSSGTDLHPLLANWRTSDWKCCGRWTPDGTLFLFLSGSSFSRTAPFFPGDQLWAIDERRGHIRPPIAQPIPLTSGPTHWGQPIPARDGSHIFARGVTLRGELVRYDGQSGRFQPFLGGISAEFADFSKDGKSVVYVSFPDGILWKANRDGSEAVQLTGPSLYPKFPRWSPDGTQILFQDRRSKGSDALYLISAHGGIPTLMLPEENEPQGDADWSPDGKQVVYALAHPADGGAAAKKELHIFNLASRATITLPESEEMDAPRWSPDGRSIAAITSSSSGALKVFEWKSQLWRTLQDGGVSFPCWSHDGRSIYFLRPRGSGVFRVSVTGGPAVRVIGLHSFRETGWSGAWLGLDPEDAPLLLHDVGIDEIYALTLEQK
ncbi:MAG: winged helix-turn-helix domain-containing protein [Terracidiphilus sp.]